MEELVSFGSPVYYLLLSLLLFARGMDFLSTWVATPNLLLEGNSIARRLGWRVGILVNVLICFMFASWPLPAIVITTTSLLVATRNFQSAWLMRSMGEQAYGIFVAERMGASLRLYLVCLGAQTLLMGMIGAGLMAFSQFILVPFAVGLGIVTYALAVIFFTLLSLWRVRRFLG
jgi:hypothetical protein